MTTIFSVFLFVQYHYMCCLLSEVQRRHLLSTPDLVFRKTYCSATTSQWEIRCWLCKERCENNCCSYLSNIRTGSKCFFYSSNTIYLQFLIGKLLRKIMFSETLCLVYSKDIASVYIRRWIEMRRSDSKQASSVDRWPLTVDRRSFYL
jgi:hypothetical protein